MEWSQIEKVVDFCAHHGQHVLLYGPPGTGKTRCARCHATNGGGVYTLNLTPESVKAEAYGYDRIHDGQFKFFDGAALFAWKHGGRLVLEEVEKASGDMYAFLLGVLDDTYFASMLTPDGTVIKPAAGFHCIGTSNCESPDDLPEALRDRFSVSIKVDAPHPQAILALEPDLRTPAARAVMVEEGGGRRASIRSFQAFSLLRKTLGDPLAAESVFGDSWHDMLGALKLSSTMKDEARKG